MWSWCIRQGSPGPSGLGYGDCTFLSRGEKKKTTDRKNQGVEGLGALERGLETPSWKLFHLGGPTPLPGRLSAIAMEGAGSQDFTSGILVCRALTCVLPGS